MQLTLFARWQLAQPSITVPLGLKGEHPVDADAASVPFRIEGLGNALSVEVGPVDARGDQAEAALSLFHRLRADTVERLGAAATSERVGVQLMLPATLVDAATVVDGAAPLWAPWLHSADVASLTLTTGARAGEWEVLFAQLPIPQSFDALVLAVAATLRALVRDLAWGDRHPDAASKAFHITRLPGGVTVHAGPLESESATRWLELASGLVGVVPRHALDTASRWLGQPLHERLSPTPENSALPQGAMGSALRILPFVSNGRPIDELEEAGTGSSEPCAFVRSGQTRGDGDDELWLLYRLDGLAEVAPSRISVRASAWFLPPPGETGSPIAVPRFQNVPVEPQRVAAFGPSGAELAAATFPGGAQSLVARFLPQQQLFPSGGSASWTWADAPATLRALVPDGEDPYTFGCLFHQRVRLELSVFVDEVLQGRASQEVRIYDLDRFGTLYGRLMELLSQDTTRQAARLKEPEIYPAHHPWYPVLGIGMNKANFYMKAVVEDARRQTRHLDNPWWLLDVGLSLELLTCLGIFEAVRDEFPELLTPVERRLFAESPRFAEVRSRINPARWRGVWTHRDILPRGVGLSAGPVSFMNLLRKQASTLEFLHAHHEDLVHAVALAGPELQSSQQAWHRVFRDAERAVTNSSLAAFPELSHVPSAYRDFALWHEKGDFTRLPGGAFLPDSITSALGDQDGVYPSAARQYRESMNHVARLCRERGLMDYAGPECVPVEVSLIEATLLKDEERFRALQARDGYGGALSASSQTIEVRHTPGRRTVVELLRTLPLFEGLDAAEVELLADAARIVQLVPTQLVVKQGDGGASMFLVESGRLKVEVSDGATTRVARNLHAGEVFGEIALLTGARRTATVSALDYATLIELSSDALEPLVRRREQILDGMSELLASRELRFETRSDLARRMRAHLVGQEVGGAELGVAELETLLGKVPLFAPLQASERAVLAGRATVRRYTAGAAVVRQGEKGRSLFIVQSGAVTVQRKDAALARLGAGAMFGELGLLTGERRSADVLAGPETVIVEISRSDFLPVMTRRPGLVVELSELLEQRRQPGAAQTEGFARRIARFFSVG